MPLQATEARQPTDVIIISLNFRVVVMLKDLATRPRCIDTRSISAFDLIQTRRSATIRSLNRFVRCALLYTGEFIQGEALETGYLNTSQLLLVIEKIH